MYDKQIEELKELASDPTLQSCCQRDLEDQIRVAHYKALLTPQDRSQARQRLSRQVFSVDNINQKGDDEPAYDGTDDEPELGTLLIMVTINIVDRYIYTRKQLIRHR